MRIDKLFGGASDAENLKNLEALPDLTAAPRIIFVARAWDTAKIDDKKQKEKVEAINVSRAECIRILRKEFGKHFFGGLTRDDYAVKNFKDCLLSDASLSEKKSYLKSLRDYPICVATIGFKPLERLEIRRIRRALEGNYYRTIIFSSAGRFSM